MSTIRIGNLELGSVPRIAAVLDDVELRRDAAGARTYADLFELRIDMFQPPDRSHAEEICREARATGVPLIATIRSSDEGGVARLDDGQRRALFQAILPLVDALDIELQAAIRDEVISLAHSAQKPVIVSLHDFQRTPPDNDLLMVIDAAKAHGADIVKIATTIAGTDDLERLLRLLLDHRDQRLIIIGMGPGGAATRVLFPLLGSLVTYGFLHRAAAPGQLALPDLVRELERYVPDFATRRRDTPT
jgi:3-dehydroquinate dehydratase-1